MNRASERGLAAEGLVCVRGERMVFRDLDFALGPGEALVLTGPNGSGKSSLLRLLAGLLTPAAGRIFWNGADVSADAEAHRARLAYVGHQNAVKRQLTVAENLTFWAGLYGGGGAAARAAEALGRLGIDHLADVPAALLSAGQHRRLALARIAAAPAPLWLLDEPTVTLDEASVGVVETLIAEQRAGGGLVVVATHTGLEVPGAGRIELGVAP